jgi:cyclopropane fatty-acyl-phospholipid synthase-like methyltransferase
MCSRTLRRCTSRGVRVALERAGFATEHVEGFTADYAETLTHWLARLEDLT